MLDSLVRVSRRVGWGANRFATDPRDARVRERSPRPDGRAVRAHCLPVRPSRTHRTRQGTRALQWRLAPQLGIPRSPGRPAPSRAITLPDARWTGSYLPERLRQPGNRSWRSPRRKCTGPGASETGRGRKRTSASQSPAPPPGEPAEFRGSTLWSHPFASMRFHVLLNSLFKVLFNFPSRYLSAIGLVSVFSLRWSLPPALGCILKQPDSGDESTRDGRRASQRPNTRSGQGPNQENSDASEAAPSAVPNTTGPAGRGAGGFGAGLLPVHSPLLRESWLVSFPPLTNMLKFSG